MSNLDKKVISLCLLFIILFSLICPLFSYAITDNNGSEIIEFEDKVLEKILLNAMINAGPDKIDTNKDGKISVNEMNKVRILSLTMFNITEALTTLNDLNKYAINLEKLSIYGSNKALGNTQVDLTKLTKLNSLELREFSNSNDIEVTTNLFLWKPYTNVIRAEKISDINLVVGESFQTSLSSYNNVETLFEKEGIAQLVTVPDNSSYDQPWIEGISEGTTKLTFKSAQAEKVMNINVSACTVNSNQSLLENYTGNTKVVEPIGFGANVLLSNGALYEIYDDTTLVDVNVADFVYYADTNQKVRYFSTLKKDGSLFIKTMKHKDDTKSEITKIDNVKAILGNYDTINYTGTYYLTNSGELYEIVADNDLKIKTTLKDTNVNYICGDYYIKNNCTYSMNGEKFADFAIDDYSDWTFVSSKNNLYKVVYNNTTKKLELGECVATDFARFADYKNYYGTYVNTNGKICNEHITDYKNRAYAYILDSDSKFYYQNILKLTDVVDYTYVSDYQNFKTHLVVRKDGTVWSENDGDYTKTMKLLLSPNAPLPTMYTVTFKDYDGKVLKEEKVLEGKSATAPKVVSTREGYTFSKWDKTFINVKSDITVTAVYKKYVSPFKDTKTDVFYSSALEYLYKNGYITGTSSTEFSPNVNLNRAMLVTILWNMEGKPKTNGKNKFKDVKNGAWYTDAIVWASVTGVVNGNKDGTFEPNKNITRQEVAVMLANYSKYKKQYKVPTTNLNKFTDNSKVANWAIDSVKWAVENKVISGANGGKQINPVNGATRGEAITMVKNYIDKNYNVKSELDKMEIQVFNAKFEAYEGNQNGAVVKSLLNVVISSNSSNPEKIVRVKFEEKEFTETEISSIITKISNANKYNISFEYTNEIITKIIIK